MQNHVSCEKGFIHYKYFYMGLTQMFSDTLWFMGGGGGRTVISLPPAKYNEINLFQSNVQKHVPYTG